MTMEVAAHSLFSGPDRGLLENVVLRHENGLITSISEGAPPATSPRSLVLPAFVNAHDHARPTASSFGAVGMPLESWILRSALGTPVDPYLTAASALARSARAGCAAMMIHYTRPSGTMPLVEEASAIARAASDVGIRIAFALAVRDQNPVVYGDEEPVLSGLSKDDRSTIEQMFVRAPMSPKAYIELTDAIAAAIAGPKVDVQLGPAGVQWCSKPLLEAVAENSAQTGRRIHMHLLETIYQRAWADRHFPEGIVRYLRDIGFLSERLTLAHCIHARPDEIEMIAASGARIVTNFSSNLHLRSGLAPIAAAHKCGCAIAVGVDGLALDEDDDVLREMRLVQMMHGGLGFERTWTTSEFLALAHRQRPEGDGCARNRRAHLRCAGRFRHHRSRSARSRPDHAGRPDRSAVRARQCVAVARCGCGWPEDRQRRPLHRCRPSGNRARVARNLPRQRKATHALPAGLAAALGVAAELVRSPARLPVDR